MLRSESCDVLHQHISGSHFANDSPHLSPKTGLGVVEAGSWSRVGDSFAGEASRDHADSGGVAEFADVWVDGRSGPPLGEDAPPPLISFAEPLMIEAGEGEAVVEEADTAEEAADRETRAIHPPPDP